MQRRDENCTADFIQIYADALDILYPKLAALDKIQTDKDFDRIKAKASLFAANVHQNRRIRKRID